MNTQAKLPRILQTLFITVILVFSIAPAFAEDPVQVTAAEMEDSVLGVAEKWTGDFDDMTERRLIRVLVVYNKMDKVQGDSAPQFGGRDNTFHISALQPDTCRPLLKAIEQRLWTPSPAT